jgi:hypothetical protein
MATGQLPRLELPRMAIARAAPITQHRRLELLGQLLTDEDRPLRSRVAACLVLLFAQPATRIVRLTVEDVTRAQDGGGVAIRFGQPPTPVPEPFASLLLQATAQRDNLQTATNPGAPWLFPAGGAASRCMPATSQHSSGISASLPWPAGPPRCASSSCRPLPPSSPRHWATTTAPPPGSRPRPERPGAATPWATTAAAINRSDHQGCPFSSDLGCGGVADLRGSDRVRSQ